MSGNGNGVEILAECENEAAPVRCRRPRWEDVYNEYPKNKGLIPEYDEDLPTEDVFKTIFEDDYYKKNKTTFSNACAVRVSIALLGAGITIGKKIKIVTTNNKIEEVKTIEITRADSKLKGKRVITGASTMHYTMLPPKPEDFGGATGHCTLWTGKNVIGGNHYAKESYVVHLWELK